MCYRCLFLYVEKDVAFSRRPGLRALLRLESSCFGLSRVKPRITSHRILIASSRLEFTATLRESIHLKFLIARNFAILQSQSRITVSRGAGVGGGRVVLGEVGGEFAHDEFLEEVRGGSD